MALRRMTGRQFVLARRPGGCPVPEDFVLDAYDLGHCPPAHVTISMLLLSIDPYVRCLLDETSPYGGTLALGQRIVGDAVSVVLHSDSEDIPVGSLVVGRTGWATVQNVRASSVRRLEASVKEPALALSALGNTGLTAYIGVSEIGRPRIGEVALVTGASGGVGVIAIQLLRAAGCDVIAVAGGPVKVSYLRDELGFRKVVDYKANKDITPILRSMAPTGIDIFFDNVGGPLSEQIYPNLAIGGRVVLCGEASQYNSPGHEFNPRILGPLMAMRASIQAFLVSDYKPHFDMYRQRILSEIDSKRLRDAHDIVDGFENAPDALIGLLRGENRGKRIVKVRLE